MKKAATPTPPLEWQLAIQQAQKPAPKQKRKTVTPTPKRKPITTVAVKGTRPIPVIP